MKKGTKHQPLFTDFFWPQMSRSQLQQPYFPDKGLRLALEAKINPSSGRLCQSTLKQKLRQSLKWEQFVFLPFRRRIKHMKIEQPCAQADYKQPVQNLLCWKMGMNCVWDAELDLQFFSLALHPRMDTTLLGSTNIFQLTTCWSETSLCPAWTNPWFHSGLSSDQEGRLHNWPVASSEGSSLAMKPSSIAQPQVTTYSSANERIKGNSGAWMEKEV